MLDQLSQTTAQPRMAQIPTLASYGPSTASTTSMYQPQHAAAGTLNHHHQLHHHHHHHHHQHQQQQQPQSQQQHQPQQQSRPTHETTTSLPVQAPQPMASNQATAGAAAPPSSQQQQQPQLPPLSQTAFYPEYERAILELLANPHLAQNILNIVFNYYVQPHLLNHLPPPPAPHQYAPPPPPPQTAQQAQNGPPPPPPHQYPVTQAPAPGQYPPPPPTHLHGTPSSAAAGLLSIPTQQPQVASTAAQTPHQHHLQHQQQQPPPPPPSQQQQQPQQQPHPSMPSQPQSANSQQHSRQSRRRTQRNPQNVDYMNEFTEQALEYMNPAAAVLSRFYLLNNIPADLHHSNHHLTPHHFHHHMHGSHHHHHHHHGPTGQSNGQDDTMHTISESKPRGLNRAEIDSLTPYIQMDEKDSRTCVICLSKYELKTKIRPLPCNHSFHAKCVDKWLRANRTCPICRRDALKTYAGKIKRI